VTTSGNYAWTIAIPNSDLAVSAKYVLRFKVSASSYDPNSEDLSSPGFLVLAAVVSSTSPSSLPTTLAPSSTNTSSTTSSSSTQTILSPSPSVSSIATSDVACSSCGLTAGAKAGIGIGIVIAVLALVGAAYFAFRRRRKEGETHTEQKPHQPGNDMVQNQQEYLATSHPIELPSYPAELPIRDVVELTA
jgi:MYXO-CTERM domain-containing protein